MQVVINKEEYLAGALSETDRKTEFERLMKNSYRRAYNLAYRMMGDPMEAEDLTQETFVRAYRFFHRFNRMLSFEAWLRQIMHNLFVDGLRRKPKAQIYSLDQPISGGGDDDEDLIVDFADNSSSPDKRIMAEQFDTNIQNALMRLPKEFREAVILCDIDDMSYDEIAKSLEVSTGTIRSRIHRGRKLLRKWLTEGNDNKPAKYIA